MKRIICLLAVVALFLLIGLQSEAQCAMCKATAESATEHSNKGIGQGLNSGIVYLMVTPYLLLAVIATVFFRKKLVAFFKPQQA
jgi:hypothetical protein